MGKQVGKPVYHRFSDGAYSEEKNEDRPGFEPFLKLDTGQRKGHAFFSRHVKFSPGEYAYKVRLGIPVEYKDDAKRSYKPKSLAIKLNFGEDCSRIVEANELLVGSMREFLVECSISEITGLKLEGYWFGGVPLLIDGLEVVSIN